MDHKEEMEILARVWHNYFSLNYNTPNLTIDCFHLKTILSSLKSIFSHVLNDVI